MTNLCPADTHFGSADAAGSIYATLRIRYRYVSPMGIKMLVVLLVAISFE